MAHSQELVGVAVMKDVSRTRHRLKYCPAPHIRSSARKLGGWALEYTYAMPLTKGRADNGVDSLLGEERLRGKEPAKTRARGMHT